MNNEVPKKRSGEVAIVGRPNAGKSTLLNTVLGTEISIVSPKAQTTRDRVLGIYTEPAGQIVFVDTPGIHRAKEGGLNEAMMNEVATSLEAPDLIWVLVEPPRTLGGDESRHQDPVFEMIRGSKSPCLLLLSKSDLHRRSSEMTEFEEQLSARAQSEFGITFEKSLAVSVKSAESVKRLLETTWLKLGTGPYLYPDDESVSDRPMRFFVGEKIREQLFHCLGDELPYACAVEIEQYKENQKPVHIEAVIHVERESQKGMVIGQGGKKIREIGTRARIHVEKLVGGPVFLGLKVKVWRDWSKDRDALKKMGYQV